VIDEEKLRSQLAMAINQPEIPSEPAKGVPSAQMASPGDYPGAVLSERQHPAERISEGAREDTAFWGALEARFRALHEEQLQNRNKAGLHAVWRPDPGDGDPWYLGGGPDDIRTMFEWLAERAAVRLAQPGGRNAVFFWLDLLKRESPHYRPVNSSHVVKGKETSWESGTIQLVCMASAEYCIKCETDELERKRRSRKKKAFVGHRSNERPAALTPEGILRGLVAELAKDGTLPAQHASMQPSVGEVGRTENKDEKAQPLVAKPKVLSRASRERGPDLKTIRERVAFEDKLRTELASVKDVVGKGCGTLTDLKGDFPSFKLWELLSKREQEELLTDTFLPKAYARSLAMRKYGLVSRDTLKKDRQKLRRASR
jgi:hypothetical protein